MQPDININFAHASGKRCVWLMLDNGHHIEFCNLSKLFAMAHVCCFPVFIKSLANAATCCQIGCSQACKMYWMMPSPPTAVPARLLEGAASQLGWLHFRTGRCTLCSYSIRNGRQFVDPFGATDRQPDGQRDRSDQARPGQAGWQPNREAWQLPARVGTFMSKTNTSVFSARSLSLSGHLFHSRHFLAAARCIVCGPFWRQRQLGESLMNWFSATFSLATALIATLDRFNCMRLCLKRLPTYCLLLALWSQLESPLCLSLSPQSTGKTHYFILAEHY